MHSLNLMVHFRFMADAAQSIGARAQLDFATLRVEVTGSGHNVAFEPEFLGFRGGRVTLTQNLEPDSVAFTGWQHGQRKRWRPDKRTFKEFCASNNLLTPRAYTRAGDAGGSVLVKGIRPSGVPGVIHGPFEPHSAPAMSFQPDTGWFLEEFIIGDIAMALYQEGELFAIEARKKPRVIGDGYSSVRELMEITCQEFFDIDWAVARNLLRLQGISLDHVPPRGMEIVVDIRFWSGLQPFTTIEQNVLGKIAAPIHEQLLHAGPILWRAIPEEARVNKQFQAYAIVDPQQRVWFVDINTDNHINPHGYGPMLRKLFGVHPPKDV